jgi:Flp pilus assembly pilin Flp
MKSILRLLQECCFNEDGAIAAEYVILLSLIAVVAIGGVTLLGGVVHQLFSKAVSLFP